MWKPFKKLVTWILVILLMYNIATLVATIYQMRSGRVVYSPALPYYRLESDGLHVWYPEVTWWTTEMNRIDNNPCIMTTHWYREWELSSYNEIELYGFKLERIDSGARLAETGETLSDPTMAVRYNWLKNLLVPWMYENTLYYLRYKGTFENLIVHESHEPFFEPENEVVRWENLNCVLVRGEKCDPEVNLSPWGPIHFVTVLGALIYVRKRWH